MKLNTRLALVVSILLAATALISSAQSLIVNRNEKLNTYKQLLNNLSTQLANTKEDAISFSLFFADNSPIPMSLAFVTGGKEISYLIEDAGTDLPLPTPKEFKSGQKNPIERNGYLIRYHQINKDEYLFYYLSTKNLYSEINRGYKPIFIFDIILILVGALIVLFIFRRDTRLNSAAKGMQEFIGDASHELKTPLTVIRGYSEMMSKNPKDSEKYALRINEESIKMTNLIDKLLKIAALDESQNFETSSIDIAAYFEKLVEDLRVLEPQRSISFQSSPLTISAPYELIDTIFSNLISNVRVHTPKSAPINIFIGGKHVVIEDGGPGLTNIPDKPFQRFDASRSKENGGSGLGMSLIQKSAKQIGAKLNFSKSELGGLKVEITF